MIGNTAVEGQETVKKAAAMTVAVALLTACSSGSDGRRALMCHISRDGSSTRTPLAVRVGARTTAVVDGYSAQFRIVTVRGDDKGRYRVDLAGPGIPPGSTVTRGGFFVGHPVGGLFTAEGMKVSYGCT